MIPSMWRCLCLHSLRGSSQAYARLTYLLSTAVRSTIPAWFEVHALCLPRTVLQALEARTDSMTQEFPRVFVCACVVKTPKTHHRPGTQWIHRESRTLVHPPALCVCVGAARRCGLADTRPPCGVAADITTRIFFGGVAACPCAPAHPAARRTPTVGLAATDASIAARVD